MELRWLFAICIWLVCGTADARLHSFVYIPFPGAQVDSNFAQGQYVGGPLGSLYSVSNSLGGFAQDLSGNLVNFAANTPRITNQGWLIETTSVTNLIIQNQFTTGWSGSGASVNANSALSPDNTNDAMFLKEDTSTGGHSLGPNSAITKAASTGVYTFSIACSRASVGTARDIQVTVWDGSFANEAVIISNLQTGIVQYNGTPTGSYVNKGSLPLSNGYWLTYVVFNATATANFNLNISLLNNSSTPWVLGGSTSYTGDGISGVYCFLPQIEAGAFPSSRVVTGASQVTRPADVVTITGTAATALNAAQGTALISTAAGEFPGGAATILDSNGTALLGFNSSGNLTDNITTALATKNTASILAATDQSAIAWDGTGRSLILNGGSVAVDAIAQTPSATLHLGASGFNGYVKRLSLWTTKQPSPQSNFTLVAGNTVLGVGVSGPENSTPNFPSSGDWAYLGSKGIKLVRLALAWENVQPTLGSALNSTEVSAINTALSSANANGIKVILDIHNYAHYALPAVWGSSVNTPGNGGTTITNVPGLGDAQLPISDFTDLFTRMATAFGGNPGLGGYGLMNEPQGLASSSTWNTAAQAAINAIRAIDTVAPIYVCGDGTINTGGFAPSFFQPTQVTGTNIVHEGHQYFDYDPTTTNPAGPGIYTSNYSSFNTTNYQGIKAIQAWLGWLKKNNLTGFLGEYGIPNSAADNNAQWFNVQGNLEAMLAQNGVKGAMFFYGANNAGSGTTLQFNPQSGVDDPRLTQMLGNF